MTTFQLLLAGGFLLMASQGLSQSDTIYFDKNWKKTSKGSAEYYRHVEKVDQLYYVNDHYITDMLQMTGSFSSLDPEVHEGAFRFYYPDGVLSSEGAYVDNKKEGKWKYYDSLGRTSQVSNFRNGDFHGTYESYHANGKLKRKETYEADEFLSGHCYAENGEEIAFFPREQEPSFVGGNGGLMQYLQENIVYPPSAQRRDIQGKVHVRFVVNEKGKVTDVKVMRGVHPLLDAEAISVVSKMPLWIPGKIDGVPVKAYYDLPINFRLD